MENLDLDVAELSESEKQAIWSVLKRDEELRKRDEQRVNRLKSELQWLRRRGAIRGGSDPMNSCSRCRCQLGKIINRGAQCSVCRGRICKSCRHYTKDGLQWICVVCHKQIEIEAATGEWMNEFIRRASRRKDKKNAVLPADKVKELIVRNLPEGFGRGDVESRPRHQKNPFSETKSQQKSRQKSLRRSNIKNIHEREQGKPMSSPAKARVKSSFQSMDHLKRPIASAEVTVSSNDSSAITAERVTIEVQPSFSKHRSTNDEVKLDSRLQSTTVSVPVPAPRTSRKSFIDVVDNSDDVETMSTPNLAAVTLKPANTVLSKQKRQAPQPPCASPKSQFQNQKNLPPPPPPPYKSAGASGEKSDSGISQDNHPSSMSSVQSGSSVRSSNGDRLRADDKSGQISQTESVTCGTDSSDLDSEFESASGVVFRKVTLKRRKKASKQRPVTGNIDVLADNCRGDSDSSDADVDTPSTPRPSFQFLTSLTRPPKSLSNNSPLYSTSASLYCDRRSNLVSPSADSVSSSWFEPKARVEGLTSKIAPLSPFNTTETNSKSNNDSERRFWPTGSTIDESEPDQDAYGTFGRLTSGLSLSLTTLCERDDKYDCLNECSSSWCADDANLMWISPEKSGVTQDTPRPIHVTKFSWEDFRISSPEYEEEDYLLQLNCNGGGGGNVTHAESFNDLFSIGVIDKIVPEGEEYRIVFISSSSSSKSSDFNDLTLEEFDDSDCEEDTLNFIAKFANDDGEFRLPTTKRKSSELISDSHLPTVTAGGYLPAHYDDSQSSRDFFNLEHFCNDFDSFDNATEDELSAINGGSVLYTFVRTNSVRSSGERSISEQCFSNHVFSQPDDQLLTFNIENVANNSEPRDNSEMSEHEMSIMVDEVEDGGEQHSFDSGTSVSDSELIGDGYIPETIDSSDDECVAWSYDVNLSHCDSPSDDNHLPEALENENEATESDDVIVNCSSEPESVTETSESANLKSDAESVDRNDDVVLKTCAVVNVELKSDCVNELDDSFTNLHIDLDENINNNSTVDVDECIGDNNLSTDTKLETLLCDDVMKVNAQSHPSSTEFISLDEHDPSNADDDEFNKEVADDKEFNTETADDKEFITEAVDDKHFINEAADDEEFIKITADDKEFITEVRDNKEIIGEEVDGNESIKETADDVEFIKITTDDKEFIRNETDDNEFTIEVADDTEFITQIADDVEFVKITENDKEFDIKAVDDKEFIRDATDDNEFIREAADDNQFIKETADEEVSDICQTTSEQLDLLTVKAEQSAVLTDENSSEDVNSELDKSDTDSQDTVIEGETYRRMRQVAIREKLLLANREWDTSLDGAADGFDFSGDEDMKELDIEALEFEPNAQDELQPTTIPVTNLHELIAKSRAMSASLKQPDNTENSDSVLTPETSSSFLEKYFTTSLEHMAPLELDRNRNRQMMQIKSFSEITTDGDEMNFEVSSQRSSEDTSEAYDSDRRFEDSSTEGDETFDDDDDSSTVSTSSDEGSMYLRPLMRGELSSNEETILMCRQTLDMSLHTIMEESCEESESEDRRRPSIRKSIPSELQRYFEFTFSGPNVNERSLQEATNELINPTLFTANNAVLLPGDRLSRTDSELSYDTMSDTESSIFSENESRDHELEDDEELARLASSRLEKYFLTGLLGTNVQNYFAEDGPQPPLSLPLFNAMQLPVDGGKHTASSKEPKNLSNPSQSESSNEEELDENSLGAFVNNDGCDTIKRNKQKAKSCKSEQNVEMSNNLQFKSSGVVVSDDSASVPDEKSVKSDVLEFEDGGRDVFAIKTVDGRELENVAVTPAIGNVSRSLMQLDWKQQSRDSGFIGSSDDLLQEGNNERALDTTADKTVKTSESSAELSPRKDNVSNVKVTNLEETTIGLSLVSSQPVTMTSNTSTNVALTTNVGFGLFRSSSRSTKSGRSVNLYTSDDEAQYIVNQLVNHIAKSMSRSPQLSRAKPPEIEAFESELTKLMQTVPAIEFTVKEIVEELSGTDHYSDSYESSDYTSSDQEGPIGSGTPLFPFQLPNRTSFGVDLERNDSGRSWRSFSSSLSKTSSVGHELSDEVMSEETMFIYEKFMDSLNKMAEHISEDAKTGVAVSEGEKMRFEVGIPPVIPKNSAPSSGKGSPPTAVRIVQHIRNKLTTLMREVHIDRSPSIGSGRSSFNSHIRPTITWNKPGSGSGSAAGDELSISSTTSSANFDSEDSPTDTELSIDSDDPIFSNLNNCLLVSSTGPKAASNDQLSETLNNSLVEKSGGENVMSTAGKSVVGTRTGDHLTLSGRPLSLMEKTPTDDESEDGLERWSSDMTIVDDDIRYSSIHKSEPMLLSHTSTLDVAVSKTLPASPLYGLSSHPNPTSQMSDSRGSMGSLLGTSGSSSNSSIVGANYGANSCQSDWDMWTSTSKSTQTSGHRNIPTKYKSCDPLPTARSTSTSVKSPTNTSTTPRDKKKHAFAFMLRQKSGSSTSLRDASNTPESTSIKQQIQFRSSVQLANVKSKEEQLQSHQQHRSSSINWLFGRNKDSNKKGNFSTITAGGWSSNPDGISTVGVDVTTAVGVDLSDSESSGHSGGIGGTKSRMKGSVNAPQVNNDSSVGDELRGAAARTSLAPQPRPRSVTSIGIVNADQSSTKKPSLATSRLGIAKDVGSTLSSFNKKSAAGGIESPVIERDVHSWPDESGNFIKISSKGPNFITTQRKPPSSIEAVSPPRYGTTLSPNVVVDENSERGSRMGGSGAGSHTGSSDPDNFPEEDIDRLVAMHTRSLSSLGVCSESMSSVYSAAGGGHYGNVIVRGEMQFGLSYNYMNGALEVGIKQCRDLAAVDMKRNRSDPYVKVYLLPDKSKGGKRKTRVKKHTLNPIFNEVLKFYVTISELETRTLWVTVWHSDMFGRNEFLGEVTLPMGYEAWEDTSPKWYQLQEKLGSPDEVYCYKGDLILALKFVPPEVTSLNKGRISKGSLHVNVKEARNLMAVSTNGTSDPFCKSYLLPDKGKGNKQKTHVIKRTCNPKWNHTFVYEDISLEEIRERCLELTIWDYDRLTSNDFLGGIRLSIGADKHLGKKVDWMDSRGEEVSLWQAMLEKPNIWVDGSVMLRPTMDHRQTTW